MTAFDNDRWEAERKARLERVGDREVEMTWDNAPTDTPLWCVYGPACFPTVFACKITNHPTHGRAIWGFSVWRRQKGYRTLGQGRSWFELHKAKLFATRAEAFVFIGNLFPHKPQP